jgi:hypothetical protein
MSKLILLSIVAMTMTGCISVSPKNKNAHELPPIVSEPTVVVPAGTKPLELDPVNWIVVTEDNVAEIWAQMREEERAVALFALKLDDYELLNENIEELVEYLKSLQK